MKKIKVCIIGCGMIANSAHIPAYIANRKDYKVVAVCDNSEDAARKTAESNGIEKWYTNPEQMLAAEKPDVVSVCAPNMFHKEYVMLALSYGANVLCEKPLELSYKEAKRMFDFAQQQGKVLMACQICAFYPNALKLKKWLIAARWVISTMLRCHVYAEEESLHGASSI